MPGGWYALLRLKITDTGDRRLALEIAFSTAKDDQCPRVKGLVALLLPAVDATQDKNQAERVAVSMSSTAIGDIYSTASGDYLYVNGAEL